MSTAFRWQRSNGCWTRSRVDHGPLRYLESGQADKARSRNADIDARIAIFSKVQIGDDELTSIVEGERAKLYGRENARHGRR